MFIQSEIDQLIDRADIVDTIGKRVDLKRAGVNYKVCCPFHGEKTPSLVVSPAKGIWKCFGCGEGGNVVNFIMLKDQKTYPEAIRALAHEIGFKLTEVDNCSEEEKENYHKRETMTAVNEMAMAYFAEQFANSSEAKEYAYKRWGKGHCTEMSIGYAPDGWSGLKEHALSEGWTETLLVDLGLLKLKSDGKGTYDAYRNRIVIPIRTPAGKIEGFTARDISTPKDPKKAPPKYINSCDSLLYSKSKSVFGLDIAFRTAVKEKKFYVVEGGPDVIKLQSLDILNTVASLGTAWTKDQFTKLRKYSSAICFIPDADPPKRDDVWGAGIKAVMTNGRAAMMLGLSVTVKELPAAPDQKLDPDSYITSKQKLRELQEEEFILWYATKLFTQARSNSETQTVMSQLAEIIVAQDDPVREEIMLNQLVKLCPVYDKKTWNNAVREARTKRTKDKLSGSNGDFKDSLMKYGFAVEHNCYMGMTKDGNEYPWSNFVMKPLFHVKDSINPKRLYEIRNTNGDKEIIELRQEDLISLARFKVRIEGLGNYIWMASDRELTKLKSYLYEQTETAVEITQLGWQHQGFYAFGNGVLEGDQWHKVDKYGIVRLESGNYYLPAFSSIYAHDRQLFQFERKFVHLGYSGISLHDYFKKMIDVSGPNAITGINFLIATLFRDIITGYTKSFPILNLFGPKGSGKSELGHSLTSFFIIENTPPNIQNSTIAALADVVAQSANAIAHIDEYKNTIDIDKREFLKGLWDGAGRTRMNMDRDKKREITSVDCGVVLSGQEMATVDIAIFSRMIFLTFDKSEFTLDQKRKFDDLVVERKKGVSHLAIEILKHRKLFEQNYKSNYKTVVNEVSKRLSDQNVEDRILRNWCAPLAAMRTLESVLDLPYSYKEALELTQAGIDRQNGECKSNNELANFWNVVSFLQQQREIFIDGDYRIDNCTKLKTDRVDQQFKSNKRVLLLRKSKIFTLYKKLGRQVGDSVLPESSLQYYLENSKEFFGRKRSVRYKSFDKTGSQIREHTDERSESGMVKEVKTKLQSQVDQALCFDYDALEANYGISLQVIDELVHVDVNPEYRND